MAWGVSVRALSARLSADELNDYMAYYSFEPWGCQADDVRCGINAYTVACTYAKSPPKFADFMPRWEPPRPVSYSEGAEAFMAYLGQ